jgi:hypothetical protein
MTSLATACAGDRPAVETEPAFRPAPSDPDRGAEFATAYPGYLRTARLDRLRASEYGYLDDRGQVYLDYTGAGLPAGARLAEHTARIAANCFGNPHSENPASVASTDVDTFLALIETMRG